MPHPCLTPGSGVDFDDPDYGYKEEDKPKLKVHHCPSLSR